MKQSLIDIKETKQRLQPDKENSTGVDFKDQVQRFSQRIDQLLERKHDKDVNKMKDRRLKMEMQRMRVQRLVKEQLTREKVGDERFQEELQWSGFWERLQGGVPGRGPREEFQGEVPENIPGSGS